MASLTDAKTIIDKASVILSDLAGARWTVTELLGWLNDGQRELVAISPSSNVKNSALQLVAGVKQSLPSDSMVLIDIPHNLGAAGTTVGAAINHVPKEVMLKRIPGWTTEMPNGVVKHYIYNPTDPLIFYIYPPQPSVPKYVECVYSAIPVLIANATAGTKITVNDAYQNALLDYLLYRAFIKDTDSANQVTRGQEHYKMFIGAVVSKMSVDNKTGTQEQAQ